MSDKSDSTSGGIGLTGLLFVLFLGLKLGHVIDWSWWWVFAPLWMPLALVLVIYVFALLFVALVWGVGAIRDFFAWATKGWWD